MKGAWRLACISIVLIGIDGNFYLAFYTFILFQLIATIGLFIWDVNPVSIISAGYKKSRSDWKKILNFSLPLVPFIMLMALNNFIDRFFITHYHGLDALAPYIAGFSLAVVITFFYSTISFTLFPELSNKWTNRNKFQIASLIKKVVIAYLALTIPFLTFLGIAGTEVLVALTTVDYFISPQILFLISFNVALYGFYQITYFLVLLGRGSANAPLIMLFVTGINILFNFLLVPEFGILGSALSGFISNSLLSIIAYKMSLDVLKWIFPFKEILIILMRSFIFGIVFFLGMIWFGKDIVSLISNLIIAGIIYSLLDFFDNKSSSFFNIIKIRNYKLNIFKFIKNNTE
tara:strand:- start:258 stop:1295 length:1038 start_codon:yes stop_codon:yes gene_type:complete